VGWSAAPSTSIPTWVMRPRGRPWLVLQAALRLAIHPRPMTASFADERAFLRNAAVPRSVYPVMDICRRLWWIGAVLTLMTITLSACSAGEPSQGGRNGAVGIAPRLLGVQASAAAQSPSVSSPYVRLVLRSVRSPLPCCVVVGEQPRPGTAWPVGSPLTLLVANGTQNERVPGSVGRPTSAALKALTAMGYIVVSIADIGSPNGHAYRHDEVMSESPAAGSLAAAGSHVVLEFCGVQAC